MDYIFGTKTFSDEHFEILKTSGDQFTDLQKGFNKYEIETDRGLLTHNFRVLEKYQQYVDNLGKYCTFYKIDSHTKDIDNTEWIKQQIAEQNSAINDILILLLGE